MQLPNEAQIIGARIHQECKRLGLTFDKLAIATGVNKGQISRFCAGDFKTWSTNLQKVCTKLQITDDLPGQVESGDLTEILKEVQSGWERAGPHRTAYENAIIALTKLTL